ncbi:basic leucine zipper transcriptional factor ATF-like 3 isoform X1 [Pelodiscus sinensis]
MSHGAAASGSVLRRSVSSDGNQPQTSREILTPCFRSSSPASQAQLALLQDLQSPEEDDRKIRRREKNRVAAQRSRKKQTQKADKLHEEYECLEQENTSLKREIGKLTDEMKHLSDVLKDHEKICPLLHCSMNFVTIPRPDALTSCLPR